ncbi:MAG TPA: serine/threonine-protein kinase [Vicinamibacterales bacterium]|nr:serine/threonine-protein kinase [Vicinamibacterales bacterium]
MSDRAVTDIASAVADGDAIDWDAARSRLSTPGDHSVADELYSLSQLTHGSREAGIRSVATLSPWLRTARLLAIASVAVGTVGFLAGLVGPQASPYPVLFGVSMVFVAAALMLDVGGEDRRARALAAGYWTVASSFSAWGCLELSRLWPESDMLRLVAAVRPEAFFAVCLWDFAREFPRITRFSTRDAWCRFGLHASLAVAVGLFVANLVPAVAPESDLALLAAPAQRLTKFAPLFWNLVFASALPALLTIAVRARESTGDEGRRARRFLYVIVWTIGPVAIEIVAEGLVPRFREWVEMYRWWIGWVVYPLLLALPLGTAYAVAARDVLEVRVVIHRGLRYLLTRWLILWGAIVPLSALMGYLYFHREQPLGVTLGTPAAQGLFWVSAVATGVLAVRERLIRLLDRVVVPGAVEPAAMLARLADRLKHSRTPIEVAQALAEAAERTLQASAEPYFRRGGRLVPVEGAPALPPESVIDVLLAGAREPCIIAEQSHSYFRLLSSPDREWIKAHGVQVIVPITSSRGERAVVGMIALKQRRNALDYSEDDIRFLRAASASASLAFEALGAADAVPATDSDEVAVECTRCRRVAAWQSEPCTCGGTWRPAALPARLASRFDVVELLGAGGMGIVYRVTDATLRRDVAAKTITRLSETAVTRLLAEAQAMAGFSHQHIAVLYGTEQWRGTPILLMEYMAGGTLAARLRRGALSEADAIALVKRLASGLNEMHAAGLFHGDIKPSNIGFIKDGTPKLLDFGLARAVGSLSGGADGTPPGSDAGAAAVAGTPAYMSPEVRDGAEPSPALDVWALCILLLESVLGTPPLRSPKRGSEIDDGVRRALTQIKAHISPALFNLLHRSLATTPRYPTSTADLLELLALLPPPNVSP